MFIAFKLSMPNVGSWNGKWSGSGNLYVIVKSFSNSKKSQAKVEKIVKGSYYYNFGDGWGASIAASIVDAKEARKLKRLSKGFYGYDWMVDSIIYYGEILNTEQRKERATQNLTLRP